jgi:ribonuclease PH
VEVLQADGGNYCACVNAATLALIDAGIPLKDYVTACTASLGMWNLLAMFSEIKIPQKPRF